MHSALHLFITISIMLACLIYSLMITGMLFMVTCTVEPPNSECFGAIDFVTYSEDKP